MAFSHENMHMASILVPLLGHLYMVIHAQSPLAPMLDDTYTHCLLEEGIKQLPYRCYMVLYRWNM